MDLYPAMGHFDFFFMTDMFDLLPCNLATFFEKKVFTAFTDFEVDFYVAVLPHKASQHKTVVAQSTAKAG